MRMTDSTTREKEARELVAPVLSLPESERNAIDNLFIALLSTLDAARAELENTQADLRYAWALDLERWHGIAEALRRERDACGRELEALQALRAQLERERDILQSRFEATQRHATRVETALREARKALEWKSEHYEYLLEGLNDASKELRELRAIPFEMVERAARAWYHDDMARQTLANSWEQDASESERTTYRTLARRALTAALGG